MKQVVRPKLDYRPLVVGKPVLVVVDMQPRFAASLEPDVMTGVLREIRAAKAEHHPIVVLELALPNVPNGICRTHAQILAELEDVNDPAIWVLKMKSTVDGAMQVLAACNTYGFEQNHFRLCGVNLSMCVFETARSLANNRIGARVEVLKDAVGDSQPDPWRNYELVKSLISVI